MAQFKFEKIQLGYEGKEITTVMALERIEFESGDTVVEIPSEHDGMPVTHILFRQSINPAHVRFHDWHHPAQGDGDLLPKEYTVCGVYIGYLPKSLKKIVFPATAKLIYTADLNHCDTVTYEIPEENKGYTVKNGKIVFK